MKKYGVVRRIGYFCSMTFLMAALTACQNGFKTEPTPSPVSQEQTQETEIISGSAVDAVTTDTMDTKVCLPVSCQQKDEQYEKLLNSKKYTWETPNIVVNPYGNSPLSAYIFFYTEDSYKVTFSVKGKDKATTILGTLKEAKFHRVPIIGLYPGKNNKVTLTCQDKNGKVIQKKTIMIQTKPLDSALKDAVKLEKGGNKSAYQLTIISGQSTPYPFAYDKNGDIRWYITMSTGSYGVFPLSNHRLIYQTDEALTPTEEKPHTTQMYEMDYLGRAYQLYYVKNGIHHEVIEKTPGGNLLLLTSSIDGHTEDVVQEIDRETGKIVKSLDMRELFDDTYVNKVDWAHLNTVSYNEKEDTILISPRNLHSAVKVNWSTNKIKWIVTNPQMFEGTKQEDKVLTPAGSITWHFQPHSIYEFPYDLDGDSNTKHIMLYDNHWQTKRKVDFFDHLKSSYVSVYTIDEKKKTVKQEKHFPVARSIITSNCAYDKKSGHMFSFGGYLYPLVNGQKGMIDEIDYQSERTVNQYSTKYYFYRGYEMNFDWNDMASSLNIGENYVKGTLQGPKKAKDNSVPKEKIQENQVSFTLIESVLYMNTTDHAITKVRFAGKDNSYVMDYTSAGKGLSKNKKVKYSIAIPLRNMKKDTYEIVVRYNGRWYDTGKNVVCNIP